jgi:hypothetical protein
MATSSIDANNFGSHSQTHKVATTGVNSDTGSVLKTLANTGKAIVQRLNLMYDIYGERRQMQNLSDDVLKDLGITRAQLNDECSRSLTDVPANRRHD